MTPDATERSGTDRTPGPAAGNGPRPRPARATGGSGSLRRPTSRSQGGFALVVALLILVGVTVLAAGGLWAVRSETRMADNHGDAQRAFQVTDAGLSQYLGSQVGVPESPVEYDLDEGTARIEAVRLGVHSGGHELYRLTAVGRLAPPRDNVERTLTSLVMLDPLQLDFPGGLSSGGNIRKDGTAGLVSGFDAATSSDCPEAPQPDRPGVITEDYEQSGGGGASTPDCEGPICGDPPIVETSDPLAGITFDWQGILDGTVVEFDHVTTDGSSWPSMTGDDWPVVFVDNTSQVSLSDAAGHSGRGTLIIRGDVKLEGDFHWDGAMMVGGSLKSAGNNIIEGATVTGLNELIGGDPADTDLGNGEKTFQYHSCNLLRAMKEAGKLYEVPGTWKESR